jgi:hypothetical protein
MPKYIVAANIMMLKCRYTLPEYYTLLYGNITNYTYILAGPSGRAFLGVDLRPLAC